MGNLFISGATFEQKAQTKIWITEPAYTVSTSGGTLTLDAGSATVHFITGSASNFSVVLPDARTLSNGTNYEIYNRSSTAVAVKYSDGSTLGVVDSESVSSLILQDNGTAKGTFSPFTVEIAQAAGILNYNLQSQTTFSTSSATDAQVTDFFLTPASGEYYISFNSSSVSTLNNAESTVSLYKNGVQIAGTERTARSTASSFIIILSTQGVAFFNGTDQLRVYVRTTTGTLSVNNRSVVMLRLGAG